MAHDTEQHRLLPALLFWRWSAGGEIGKHNVSDTGLRGQSAMMGAERERTVSGAELETSHNVQSLTQEEV